MRLPADYSERVYAGVLGKIIGVYLGRPFEGWTYERIMAELGEISGYVHTRLGKPLIVTDDDITGTFTFLRALPDSGYDPDLSAEAIGHTWLNTIIENRTILWWGGLGMSTEHTAYLRLKAGLPAPYSGAAATNGAVVAEQIGAQIFIDGWGMVCPGDPERAADLARRAASVSHDGEAIYGAMVIAAMEALAFVESDTQALLDTAVTLIPPQSTIYRLIADVRGWHAQYADWRDTRQQIAARYGYDRFPGNCHIVPNHALIHLGLLYGADDFQKSLLIVNTAGWDTDCNSGNLGCLLGIKNGLAAIDASPVDWRGPVADRLYLPTAEGGRAISDAAREALAIVNSGRALQGLPPLKPKGGARFHFSLPGSVQGFLPDGLSGAPAAASAGGIASGLSASRRPALRLSNAPLADGSRALALDVTLTAGAAVRAATATFTPPDALTMPGYNLVACPTLYAGQTVRARLVAEAGQPPLTCRLFVKAYGADDTLLHFSPAAVLPPGGEQRLEWRVPFTGGAPIYAVGLEIAAETAAEGRLYLDYLTWDGTPDTPLQSEAGQRWPAAWVNAVDQFVTGWLAPYNLVQNRGTGLLIQGTDDWHDYRVQGVVRTYVCAACGIAVRVRGLRRWYALLLVEGGARLVKRLDDDEVVLAEAEFEWAINTPYELALDAQAHLLRGWLDGRQLFAVQDYDSPLLTGAAAFIVIEGSLLADGLTVGPVPKTMP